MALLNSTIDFTGRIGGISAYKMKGVDKTVLRKPGGGSRDTILHSPSCIRTRENAAEFGRCSKAASRLKRTLMAVNHLPGPGIHAQLVKLSKSIQRLDTTSARGERGIFYSQHRQLLTGHSFNKSHPFDTVIRYPVTGLIDRATGTATILLPELAPSVNFFLPWPAPQFRLIAGLGVVEDDGSTADDYQPQYTYTPWHPVQQRIGAATLALTIPEPGRLTGNSTLILSIGIETEVMHTGAQGPYMERTGAAKILLAG